jgi:hypothetical protein
MTDLTPHEAIVQLIGNTFGSGDEWAADVLYAIEGAGYIVVRPDKGDYNHLGAAINHVGWAKNARSDGETSAFALESIAHALIAIAERLPDARVGAVKAATA